MKTDMIKTTLTPSDHLKAAFEHDKERMTKWANRLRKGDITQVVGSMTEPDNPTSTGCCLHVLQLALDIEPKASLRSKQGDRGVLSEILKLDSDQLLSSGYPVEEMNQVAELDAGRDSSPFSLRTSTACEVTLDASTFPKYVREVDIVHNTDKHVRFNELNDAWNLSFDQIAALIEGHSVTLELSVATLREKCLVELFTDGETND